MIINRFYTTLILMSLIFQSVLAQRVPNESENIDYLVTYGKDASTSYGDDDFTQIFFFTVPMSQTDPVYLRVYDPDIGGKIDDVKGKGFNSKAKYSIYGGEGALSHEDAQALDPKGNFKSGVLLASKVFGEDERYDGKWYTFGPFNPLEGEKSDVTGGYIFKIIAEGVVGDDCNLYRYFLSVDPDFNKEVEGANAFSYEYTFRLPLQAASVSHIYPFIDKDVISINQHNFDFDGDGEILIYSVVKNRQKCAASGDKVWSSSKHIMTEDEQNTTVDLQIIKKGQGGNDMVVYITNQYNKPVPFFAIPIGGPPKFKYKVKVKYH